jgi:hypothetical protein
MTLQETGRLVSKHGAVEVVYTGDLPLVEQPLGGPYFVVLGTPGSFRAELRACLFDDCLNGKRECCAIRLTTHHGFQHAVKLDNGKTSHGTDAWLKHTRTHCHDWHWPTVERFALDVLATYGAKRQRPAPVGVARGMTVPMSAYAKAHLAELTKKYADQSVGAA